MKSKIIGTVKRYDEARPVHIDVDLPSSELPLVIIHTEAIEEMYYHAAYEMQHEVGGYFLGFPVKDVKTGVCATYIESAIRAIYNSTPTHVLMHPESFNQVEVVREKNNTILVGYYHSHPRLNIFQSGTDVKNFKDYHSDLYQIAVVVDPSKTKPEHIFVNSDWIGYFGWNKRLDPVLLPPVNIRMVKNRPLEIAKADMPVEIETSPEQGLTSSDKNTEVIVPQKHSATNPEAEKSSESTQQRTLASRNLITKAFWEASDWLRRGLHPFNSQLPIFILPDDVERQILSANHELPDEGLLLGVIGNIAGYRFISVIESQALRLEGLKEFDEYLQKLNKKFPKESLQAYAAPLATQMMLEGLRPVGFYCGESRFQQFNQSDRNQSFLDRLFFRQSQTLKTFIEYCGESCLVAARKKNGDTNSVSFRLWNPRRAAFLELPESQIVLMQGGNSGQIHTTKNDQGMGSASP
ncbi:MAG: hypothetical protein V7641_4555 [Blastocatellia bacterium]